MNVRRTALYFVLLALIAVHAHAEDEEGAEDTGEDGGDEDGEDEEELSHRNSLTWGRIFVEGGVQHRQFSRRASAMTCHSRPWNARSQNLCLDALPLRTM